VGAKGAPKTGGRKPGSKNKATKDVRESILNVYEKIGGDEAFAEWAKKPENQKDYYQIYAKLVPRDINVDATVRLEELVAGGDDPNTDTNVGDQDGDGQDAGVAEDEVAT